MPPAANPVLCSVTDRHLLGPDEDARLAALSAAIRRAIAASVDWIQIREKDLSGKRLSELVRDAVGAAGGSSTRILVNDRLDIALGLGAAGVHLGEESVPVAEVIRWRNAEPTRRSFLVGASCHSLAAAQQAEHDGADYIFFGPVFDTPAKRKFGPPQGLERLSEVCRAARVPVLAIGGITLENAPGCLRSGAAGLAAIRLFQDSPDLPAVLSHLRGMM
ncbi:MAG TPA: thiamine phosphate synthase [Candidatus Acidoferrales bacterium]|nr:thiamine phosphate synthase [Candidatus Acidoferrales bacterium]